MRTPRRTTALLVAFALPALGAAAGHAQSPGPGEKPDPGISDGSAQRALTAARAKWKLAHVRSYRVRAAHRCFCPPQYTKPRTITVRNGVPVHPPSSLRNVATVPRMFRVIQGAIDKGVAGLTVKYGVRGVPHTITIDVSRMIADEEAYYTFDRFVRLG